MADKGKALYEKHQRILADLLREEENKTCADCGGRGKFVRCVSKAYVVVNNCWCVLTRTFDSHAPTYSGEDVAYRFVDVGCTCVMENLPSLLFKVFPFPC